MIVRLIGAFLALAPLTALAQHRTDTGVARVRADIGSSPEVIGLSLGIRALDGVELEAGAGAFGWHVRAGAPILLGKNGDTQLEVIPAVGWGKFWHFKLPNFETTPRELPHATIGLGVTRWFSSHFGLEARLTGGAAYAQDVKREDGSTDTGGFFALVTLGAGVTF